MESPPPDPGTDIWALVRYYGFAALVGCLGSCAGLLVDHSVKDKPIRKGAVIRYLICGLALSVFAALIMQETMGRSPLALGIIGFAAFKAVDVLTAVGTAAGALLTRTMGRGAGDDG